jgi:hypothetical protein
MSDFIASLDAPLGIPKPNLLALVSFDLPIAKGDKIHCLDVLHSLTKYTLGFIDDNSEDFSKVNIKKISSGENFVFKGRLPHPILSCDLPQSYSEPDKSFRGNFDSFMCPHVLQSSTLRQLTNK